MLIYKVSQRDPVIGGQCANVPQNCDAQETTQPTPAKPRRGAVRHDHRIRNGDPFPKSAELLVYECSNTTFLIHHNSTALYTIV